MKESKAVYVTKRNIKDNLSRDYNFYVSHVIRDRDLTLQSIRYEKTQEVGTQYDCKRDIVCTCRNLYGVRKRQDFRYLTAPHQVFAYHEKSRSFTDIGIGTVQPFQRKKVKIIYLPKTNDRGCGSSDLSNYLLRKPRQYVPRGYYKTKKTTSKCVGGVLDYKTVSVMSEKLSPIIQTASGSISPRELENKDIKIGNNTITMSLTDTTTQVEDGVKKETEIKIQSKESTKHVPQSQQHLNPEKIKITITKHPATTSSVVKEKFTAQEKYSSDSLVQHIHDLESPLIDKQSRCSEYPMKNKLERVYRKIFTTNSKQSKKSNTDSRLPDYKSASILKRRFEALRRGLGKKEDSSKNSVFISKLSSQVNMSAASHRDVSINSDPPSLEARSYSHTKMYSPHAFPSIVEHDKAVPYSPHSIYERSISSKQTDRNALSWPKTDEDDSESQGVKGMFKLWGKKFNLEDDHYRSNTTPKSSYISKKGVKKERPLKISSKINAEEKEKRKFFFFKKKNKEKTFKTKKGVTAGRCEVKDGLMIKIGNVANDPEAQDKRLDEMSDIFEETMKSAWLHKYLSQGIESRNSVKIRWNNKTYTASSSTVFELMENIYKDQGKVFRSKSEVTIESSYYKSYTRHHQVNFMQQNVEAWMIPQTIITGYAQNLPIEARPEPQKPSNENMEVTSSDQKWLIDKSKAFSHKIEVVLLSKNFVRCNKKASSEYLRIDIPKGFFVNSSEASADSNNVGNKMGMYKQSQSSDEEVYKIVEYETGSDTKKERNTRKVDTGYHKHNNIKLTVSVNSNREIKPRVVEKMIKSPPAHREVLIQGSNDCVPKRCDVIGVGIITRRDMHLSDSRQPILKIVDYSSDDDSEHDSRKPHNKKCELAESYLQDYYRNCTSLGLDFFSWHISDSRLRCCSETSKTSFLNQGDGTKSCPNIFDDYQIIVSSCDTSSRFIAPDYDPEPERPPCWYQKLKKRKPCDKPQVINMYDANRMYSKDSIAVCKKRKLYAKSNKSKWGTGTPCCQTPIASMPSYECKSSGSPCSKEIKPCWKPTEIKPKRKPFEAKHVSFPNCEEINDLNEKLNDCCEPESILSVKGTPRVSCGKKEAKINPIPSCHIPPTPCRSSGERMPKPPCRNSKVSCDQLLKSKTCSPPCSPPISVSVICPPLAPCVPCQSPPTPPCKSTSPPPCKTPSPPCRKPSPPCKKPSPPCKKTSLPFCKKPSPLPCKKPSPCKKLSPPVCKKPSPPVCKKPSPPPCEKPSPPPCKKPPCKKPSPPRCKKPRHSKVASPTCSNTSSKTSSSSGSCNKPTGLKLSSPPISRKCSPIRPPCPHSHPPCPGTPPSCCVMSPPCPHAFPRCPFSPPSCPHTSLPCPPPCPYAVICPPQTPQKCPSTPSTCPYSSPCYSPPPCKKPPCPPKPSQKNHLHALLHAINVFPGPGHCVADEQIKSPNLKEKTSDYKAPFRYSPIHPCPGQCIADEKIKSPNLEEKTSDLTHNHSGCCNSMKTKQESSTQSLVSPLTDNNTSKCQKLRTPQMSCETIPPSPPKRSTCVRSCPNHPDQTAQQPTSQKNIVCPPSPPPPPPPCPPPPPPSIAPSKPREGPTKPSLRPQTPNKNKVTGVHLKMSPSKKQSNSAERVIWENPDNAFDFNSDDKITIRLKKQTPSTEEIREGLNIKVQDEDGMTLYERKDYRQRAPVYERTSPSLLGDLYRHSHVHRDAASLPAQTNSNKDCHKEVLQDGSDTSIANTIEIQFKLKVTQGDKTTEINIVNDKVNVADSIKDKPLNKMPQDVFVLNHDGEHAGDQSGGKNDINIRIIIKKFKPKGSKKFTQRNDYVKEFAKQISTKFHSVSTAPEDTDRTFSIHRATVDLTSSIEKQSRHENQGVKSQLLEPEPEKISARATEESICRCVVEDRLSTIGDGDSPSRSSNNESQPSEIQEEWEPEKDEREADTDIEKPETDIEKPETDLDKPETDTDKLDTDTERLSEPKHNTILFTDTDDPDTILEQDDEISKESVEKIVKPRKKEEKNKMLKNVFEKAHDANNPNPRTKLMNVLKVVLTSDSSGPDLKAPNDSRNDLAKGVTYASLKPNYFRDTNSINNYYKGNSINALSDRDINQQVIYPTEENNRECTKSSYVTTDNDTTPPKQGCMCSTVAKRLKMVSRMCNIRENCCCIQRKPKNIKSEETCCDLEKDFEYDYDTNYNEAEYVDVQTQNSRNLSSKVTSANFSIHSQLKTNIILPHFSIQQNITTHSKLRNKEESKRDMQQFPEPSSPPMNQMRKLNQKTILTISDEDKIVLLSVKPEKDSSEDRQNYTKGNLDKMNGDDNKTVRDAAHILQSYETKKAVLEIYTENSAPDKESRLVAKLPKFAYETENDVYDAIATNANTFKSVYKRNIVMMTINR